MTSVALPWREAGLLGAVVAAGVAATLLAERKGSHPWTLLAKMTASLAFVALGFLFRAPPAILLALALSAVGDVLLVWRDPRVFRAGILAFLAAHLAYVAAFLLRGVDPRTVALGLALLLPAGALFAWRLLPRVPGGLGGVVVAYVVVITGMAALAAGTGEDRLVLAALLFYASDLLVARDRFARRAFWHRAVGLPMYYAAQLLFALSA